MSSSHKRGGGGSSSSSSSSSPSSSSSSSSPKRASRLAASPPAPITATKKLPASAPLQPRAPYAAPLLLTVRFSTSDPDLQLDITQPAATTIVALKHLIRARLAPPNSQRRLRFIHAGRILPDGAALSAVLRVPPPPPSAPPPDRDGPRGKGKGKEVEGRPERTYVHCSIGDSLTDDELRDEARAAREPPATAADRGRGRRVGADGKPALGVDTGGAASAGASANRRPRGFDQFLDMGFTPAEVAQLRLTFRNRHAERFTPDTMPSPDTMRGMEDAWLESSGHGAAATGPAGAGGLAGAGDAEALDAAAATEELGIHALLDAMVPGMAIGFVMPLTAVMWMVREDGLVSKRFRVMMLFGFVLSVTIGLIRAVSGDPG